MENRSVPFSPENKSVPFFTCFAIVYLVWGASYVVTRIGVHELPPLLFGGVRFTLSGLLLWGVAYLVLQRARRRALAARAVSSIAGPVATSAADGAASHYPADAAEWRRLAVAALCTILISNGCNTWALQWLPSYQAALLNATSAFWIAILGTMGRRAHALTPMVVLGLAIGFAGTALVLWPDASARAAAIAPLAAGLESGPLHGASARPHPAWPPLVILAGCLGWAIGTIYLRNAQSRLALLSFTGLQMLLGGLMLLVAAAFAGEFAHWRWSAQGLAAMLYLMLLSSCVAYAAYGWLTRHATPAQVGTYGFVNPAIAVALGALLLGERFGLLKALGTLVILAGVVLVSWPSRRSGDAEPAPEAPG